MLTIFLILFLSHLIPHTESQSCSVVPSFTSRNIYSKLWSDVNKKIDATLRPAVNASVPTIVEISSNLRNIMRLKELDESLELVHWVTLFWIDSTICWDPADYNGIQSVRVPSNRVWVPDLTIYEQLSLTRTMDDETVRARIFYNGQIIMGWSERVKVHCPLGVAAFPWDIQTCKITITSWSYKGDELRVKTREVGRDFYEDNSEWTLLEYTGTSNIKDFPSGKFYDVTLTLTFVICINVTLMFRLERNADYYVITLILPAFVITTLCIVGLFSPFSAVLERQEKVTLGLTALLTMSVILLMVSNLMPKNAEQFPLLGVFIIFEMSLTAIATIVAVCIMYVHSRQAHPPVKRPPNGLMKMLCMKPETRTMYAADEVYQRLDTPENVELSGKASTSVRILNDILKCVRFVTHYTRDLKLDAFNQRTWTSIAFRLDTIAFVLFMAINIIVSFFMLVVRE